jgi:hypothetical protein
VCGQCLNGKHATAVADGTLPQRGSGKFFVPVSVIDRDGVPELVLEGVNDGYGQATLVVFDARHVSGASVQPAGDFRQLQNFGPGSEKGILFFPRTCVSAKRFAAFNRAFQMQVGADYIRVVVSESIYERENEPYCSRNSGERTTCAPTRCC